MKNNNTPARNTLEAHQKRYSAARVDLLLMIALTVVNIVLMFFGSDTMMLFSAIIPYTSVVSAYYYNGGIIFYIIAFTFIALYTLCWFMSKKKYQWLIVATVLFALDTVYLTYIIIASGEVASSLIDLVIHAFVLYYLIAGIITGKNLKKAEADSNILGEGIIDDSYKGYEDIIDINGNTLYKRRADTEVKSRTFVEVEHNGHHISYRRVKRINELIIDGYVYDEIEMLVETPHELSAILNGNIIKAGIGNNSISYISVNDEIIAKKFRLV